MIHPSSPLKLRWKGIDLVFLVSDRRFNSPSPVMGPAEKMFELCEPPAVFMIDTGFPLPNTKRFGVSILLEMLRSATRLRGIATHWTLVEEE